MLVLDVHALRAVDLLDLVDEVDLGVGAAADLQQLVRVDRSLVELVAGRDLLALLDEGDLAAELGISEDGELEGFGFGDTAGNGDAAAGFGDELADLPAGDEKSD